ncbi:hypothetical protein ANN_15583 [Periplaneta americana]|uniref:Uncharacterized protein n=1 Tax=Periplaneta americana TaxID=6978 RepID=A0ABQ8SHG9_PERAM|nr:hypothetical protein ANN_15583 [Periplaneta americana]
MVGLCEGGNEPPGSLKATRFELVSGHANRYSTAVVDMRSVFLQLSQAYFNGYKTNLTQIVLQINFKRSFNS